MSLSQASNTIIFHEIFFFKIIKSCMHLVFANKIRYGTAYWLVIETINQYNVAALSPISAGALFICTSNQTVSVAYKIYILNLHIKQKLKSKQSFHNIIEVINGKEIKFTLKKGGRVRRTLYCR